MKFKYLLIMILSLAFILPSVLASAAEDEDTTLRLKMKFYEETGIYWYDATEGEREQFFKDFMREEKKRKRDESREERKVRREEKTQERAKTRELREKESEKKKIEREELKIHKEKERQIKDEKRRMREMKKDFERKRRLKNSS